MQKSQEIPKFWVSESFCVLHRNMQSTEGWKGKNGFLCKRPNLWFLNCKQPCRILKHMAICKWFWPTQQFARTNYALWQTTSESQSFCHLLVREKRSASYYKGVSMGHTPKWPLKRSKFRHLLSGWFWWLNTGFSGDLVDLRMTQVCLYLRTERWVVSVIMPVEQDR